TAFFLFDAKKKLKRGPQDTREKLLSEPKQLKTLPKGWTVLAVPQNMTVVSCPRASGCPCIQRGQENARTYWYLFKFYPDRADQPVPEATGTDLKLSAIKPDISSQGQGNVVLLGFKSEGNKKFHEI